MEKISDGDLSKDQIREFKRPKPTGQKHDHGKLRMSLLPAGVLPQVLAVLGYGAEKYAPDNWKRVPDAKTRYYDAAHRHLEAWWSGEQTDEESGHPHLAHAICSLMFLMWLDAQGD